MPDLTHGTGSTIGANAAHDVVRPIHITYEQVRPDQDLRQGDILGLTAPLKRLLEDVHQHFLDDKYAGFIVLTQSCDLVRRQTDSCKSRYINLAVIRPLDDVWESLVERVCEPVVINGRTISGAYLMGSKPKAHELLDRIVNQNEQSLGIFYLHNDAAVGLADPCVALLQVSIAVRAKEHYRTLLDARRGGLTAEFQSRLGWLAGNLYSRVATRELDKPVIDALQKRMFAGNGDGQERPTWVLKQRVQAAQGKGDLDALPPNEVIAAIERGKIEQSRDTAIRRAKAAVQAVVSDIREEQLESIGRTLVNDVEFTNACRRS